MEACSSSVSSRAFADSERLITAISVTGHSDRNPVRAANDSNQKLSQRRVEIVVQTRALSLRLAARCTRRI